MSDFYSDDDALETFERVFGVPPRVRPGRPSWTLSGGPRGPLIVPGSHLRSDGVCTRPAGGTWEHYLPVGDRYFEYAGPCVEFHDPDEGAGPCCGGDGECHGGR